MVPVVPSLNTVIARCLTRHPRDQRQIRFSAADEKCLSISRRQIKGGAVMADQNVIEALFSASYPRVGWRLGQGQLNGVRNDLHFFRITLGEVTFDRLIDNPAEGRKDKRGGDAE